MPMNLDLLAPVLAGVALSLPFLAFLRRGRRRGAVAAAAGLIVAAALYVVFAAAGGSSADLLLELGGVLLFGAVALLGLRLWLPLLAIGWAVHVAWDVGLHSLSPGGYAPWWYPKLCVGFDLFVAGFLLAIAWTMPGGGRGTESPGVDAPAAAAGPPPVRSPGSMRRHDE